MKSRSVKRPRWLVLLVRGAELLHLKNNKASRERLRGLGAKHSDTRGTTEYWVL